MKIKELLNNVEILSKHNFNENTMNLDILNVCDNSLDQNLLLNSLFVCINGNNFDSHIICKSLQFRGVKFIVCERDVETDLPYIIVDNTRKALPQILNNFYNLPTKKFKLIGVIGTNGKTSTTYFVKKFCDRHKIKCSLIGTSGVYINNKKLEETLTTPDPILLFSLFNQMAKAKTKVVVMEISAHAIFYAKTYGILFDTVIFTNFSQDHLDFFKTMENYKNTKISFFNPNNTKSAVINFDDEVGKELIEKIDGQIPILTYSLNSEEANLYAKNIKLKLNNTQFDLIFKGKSSVKVKTMTNCEFNVYNILASVSALSMLNFKITKFNRMKGIIGRFDVFKITNKKFVIIDYAHTPESLREVLRATKSLCKFKIISLFGCPGNRDETKRELMGKIANEYCSKVIITSDNPKYENPLIIAKEIEKGILSAECEIELNREKAIENAIKNLQDNEVLLVLGKGSEKYQDYNNLKIPYNDYVVVKKCIKMLKKQ